jgi:predicted nuclease of predicted toxin-antitoxin system
MALRFLADHCIPNAIVKVLNEANHEVIRLRNILPTDSVDSLVIAKAQEITAILISLNGDFADTVTYPPGRFCGIIALQIRTDGKTDRVLETATTHGALSRQVVSDRS